MKQEIIQKYNVPVPRYTSYPPANYFEASFDEEDYRKAIRQSDGQQPAEISFYLHIPFCAQLCHYCGCNSYPYADKEQTNQYIRALHKEIELITGELNPARKIAQIHYGGGTPTLLPAEKIKALNEDLLQRFETIDRPEIAIECHPGWLNREQWKQLMQCGFNRYSIGVQDFNPEVLKLVNRQPAQLPVEEITAMLHDQGARVNLDLLYGLPHQSVAGFTETLERAIRIRPDRLVAFSYAHVPWAFPRQKILETYGLPDSETKSRLYETARRLLTEAGYKAIGLDHFVWPDDELYQALQHGQLHRNFQGYCTRRTTGQVYAFGVTAISQLASAYAQNTKDLSAYIRLVGENRLPVCKGYSLTEQEQITRTVIETLMCNYQIDWDHVAQQCRKSPEEVKAAIGYNEARLREFAADRLIRFTSRKLEMTEAGALFVRNVAASFDKLMLHSEKSFSKPV